ncbi:MAG: hypothetical protein E6J73_20950, partial [Deltaproteobacteria bacterium]
MGYCAAQHLRVSHARQSKIAGIDSSARDLLRAVDALETYPYRGHRFASFLAARRMRTHSMQNANIDISRSLRLRIMIPIMGRKEPTRDTIRKVILDTYRREVQPSPFFNDLRAGNLSQARLQGWIKNWYSFALEVNTGMATVYHQFVGFFKRHPDLENRIAQKIGEEFTTPAIGGHARMLPILGKALGVSADEMIECELIPEARGLVDFFVRSWIDIPLAECFAVHMEEEIFGFISRDFRQSLPKYGVSNDDMKYFRVHEEADL